VDGGGGELAVSLVCMCVWMCVIVCVGWLEGGREMAGWLGDARWRRCTSGFGEVADLGRGVGGRGCMGMCTTYLPNRYAIMYAMASK
jgi:hypothetical protein